MIPSSRKITITIATIESRMCPTLIVGKTADGTTVYARYRWGHLSVRIDAREPAPHGGAAGAPILEKKIDPDGIDGCLSYHDLQDHTAETLVWPENPTPTPRDEGEPWLDL